MHRVREKEILALVQTGVLDRYHVENGDRRQEGEQSGALSGRYEMGEGWDGSVESSGVTRKAQPMDMSPEELIPRNLESYQGKRVFPPLNVSQGTERAERLAFIHILERLVLHVFPFLFFLLHAQTLSHARPPP